MAKSKQQKQSEVTELTDNLKSAKAVVFTSFDGLTVAESQALRNLLRKEGIFYKAAKKTLLAKALIDSGLAIDVKILAGSLGLAFGQGDEVVPAKLLAKFAKNKENLKIQGGILEGAFISAAKVMELAKLPGKQELLAQLVGTIKSPISGLVNVMAGNLRGLVNVLNAVKDAKN